MRVQLVVNQTRVRTDAELGAWMSGLVSRHYGVALDELGHIEHDDTVWLTVRRNKPLLVDSPASKSARNIERIARRVLALATAKAERRAPRRPCPPRSPTLYAVLGVTRSASDEEIRRAYKRAARDLRDRRPRDGRRCSTARSSRRAQRKLDEAYDTLLDPVRRRAYDLSTFPEPRAARCSSARTTRPALAAEQLMLQEELQREIGPETEFTGALLRKVRESQGLELADISAKTKIARAHLQAIEDERFEDLPGARLHARLPRRAREAAAARSAAGAEDVPAPHARGAGGAGQGARVTEAPARGAAAATPSRSSARCSSSSRSCRGCYVALAWAGEPVWDGHYYDFGARRIAAGPRLLGRPRRRRAPRLAPVVPLPGRLQRVPRALLPRPRRGPRASPPSPTRSPAPRSRSSPGRSRGTRCSTRRARAAGLLVALHPGLILYAALVMTEPLAALAHARSRSGSPSATRGPCAASSLGALVLGVAALVRPQALLCAPFLAVLVPAAERRARWRARAVAAAARAARSRSCRCCRGPRATAA